MALSPQERSRRMRLNMLMAMSYAVAGRTVFTPSALFASGEQGVWYDPSDFSTMFQDSSGTTPVTAAEQPVGLILDKSKGLTRTELLTNGGFASDISGWTTQNATAAVTSGQVTITNTGANGGIYQAITTVVGRQYYVSIQLVGVTGGGNVLFFIKSDSTNWASPNRINMVNGSATVQTYTAAFTATATTSYIHIINGNVTVGHSITVDNASVIDIAGNHASQSTDASRPVLSARVNLLTYSEQFDNAAWVKTNGTSTSPAVTANDAIAPDGTLTADKIDFGVIDAAGDYSVVQQRFDPTATLTYNGSVYLKAASAGDIGKKVWFYFFDTAVQGLQSLVLTSSWQKVTSTASVTAGALRQFVVGAIGSTYGGENQGAVSAHVWGADLRVTNDGVGLPAYQRIAAATDYDTTGFPYYLRFDGTDDSLATAAIDFSATDKMSLFAGVRKLSDAAVSVPLELSATSNSNNGAFTFIAPSSNGVADFQFAIRGSQGTDYRTATSYAAPTTRLISTLFDISNAQRVGALIPRINGVVDQTTPGGSSNAGTGNFGNYPLYIGRRGGSTLPAAMRLYSLIVRGALPTAAELANTETYTNNLTKAY